MNLQKTIEPSLRDRNLTQYTSGVQPAIERALLYHLPIVNAANSEPFNDALEYAVFPGGKRLRPILTVIGAEVVGGCIEDVLSAAVAIEYAHTSSLIFDDLPCMDNARVRRGKASLHVRYGEPVAILVALTLINASYSLILNNKTTDTSLNRCAHSEYVKAAYGLIYGQFLDLTIGNGLESRSHRNVKTSALISVAVQIGAILSGANKKQLSVLSRFGDSLGNAYQISDDLIDTNEDTLNISSGGHYTNLTIEQCEKDAMLQVRALTSDAKHFVVEQFGAQRGSVLLCSVADYVADRHQKLASRSL